MHLEIGETIADGGVESTLSMEIDKLKFQELLLARSKRGTALHELLATSLKYMNNARLGKVGKFSKCE